MPEPGYAGGESPGFWGCLIGFVLLFIISVLLASCS